MKVPFGAKSATIPAFIEPVIPTGPPVVGMKVPFSTTSESPGA